MNNIVQLSEVKTRIEARLAAERQQTAEHVACVSVELGEMAANAEMPFLKHLLDMATEEAVQQSMPRRRWTDTVIRPAELVAPVSTTTISVE